MSRFGVIDLSQLGRMLVLDTLSSEAIIVQRMLKFKELWMAHDPPLGAAYDVDNLEFDPIKINQECGAFGELLLRDRINQAARGLALAYAIGTDLDAIASDYPVGPRLAGESDDRYRRRTQASLNALSPHGPAGAYMYFALTADVGLKDVSETGIEGTGEVIVTALDNNSIIESRSATGNQVITKYKHEPRPSLARLLAIRAFIQAEYRKAATDILTVAAPIVKDTKYRIQVWLFPPPDKTTVLGLLQTALEKTIEDQRWLGYDHTRMAIFASLKQEGVHTAKILEPADDVFVDQRGIVRVTSIEITYMGRSE